MTKAELISEVAKKANITKAAATKSVDYVTDTIARELKRGERMTLPGFGSFSVGRRKARTGRNPQTGHEIKIPASKTVKFKPAMALKEAVK